MICDQKAKEKEALNAIRDLREVLEVHVIKGEIDVNEELPPARLEEIVSEEFELNPLVEFEINRLKRLISIGDHQVEQQGERIAELEQQLKMQSDLMEESEGDLTTKLLDAQGCINQLEGHLKDSTGAATYWRNLYETETASSVKDCGEKAKAIALLRAEITGQYETHKRLEAKADYWNGMADNTMQALAAAEKRIIKLKAKVKKLKGARNE